jgi:AcrR family transcriptional regulator
MNNELNIQDSAGAELRARIVAAARERFQQFGYAKTSMQEIAASCGMSAANLYRFHDGKLALGAAVAGAEQAEQLAAVDLAVRAAGAHAADQLIALFHANIDAMRRQMKRRPMLFELWLTVAREKPELRRQFLHEIEARIMAILAVGHDMSAFESAAIKLRGRLILMANAPFILPWMMQNEPFGNPRAMVEPLIRSLAAGLAAEPPAANTPTPARFS